MALTRLGTKDGLHMIEEVYGVAECIILRIIKEFCKMVRLHLQKKKLFKFQTKSYLDFTKEFA